MRKITIALITLVALGAGFLLWLHYAGGADSKPADTAVNDHESNLFGDDGYYGKALIVLIDGTEVYCGNGHVPKGAMEDYVLKTMELNKVRKVAIVTSISTRYGDVVALLDRLRKRGIRVVTVSTKPVSAGTRLPAVD